MVTWPMTSGDPKRSNSWPHISVTVPDRRMRWGITRQVATNVIDHYWKFLPQLLKSGSILWTSGRQFPITISTPVTISILVILNRSQLDARSLIQTERNKKALKRKRCVLEVHYIGHSLIIFLVKFSLNGPTHSHTWAMYQIHPL